MATLGLGAPTQLGRVAAEPDPTANPVPISPFSLVTPAGGHDPSVSGTGQFVVYAAAPGTDDGRTSSIWLVDRQTGETSELTKPVEGIRVGNSVHPTISADGCSVVIVTEIPYDLFRDSDRGSRWDVYASRTVACGGTANDWVLVSTVLDDGGQAEARNDVSPDQSATISSAGSAIAYVRPFVSRSGNDNPDRPASAVDLVDLTVTVDDEARVTPVPGLPTDAADNGADYVGQTAPRLSADGSTLVFSSDAAAELAVATWIEPLRTTGIAPTQIYAWDRNDLNPFTAVTALSVVAGAAGDASSTDPTVSDDGRIVAFSSLASNFIDPAAAATCGVACPAQIYVVDRDTDGNGVTDEVGLTSVTLVSRAVGAADQPLRLGNGDSVAPALSGDGISVAFQTRASNLLPVQTPGGGDIGDGDIVIADRSSATPTLRRGFDSLTPAPSAHGRPHLSANGRVLIADSAAADDILGDPNLTGRYIVAARFQPTLSIASLDLGTGQLNRAGQAWSVNVINLGPGAITPTVSVDNTDYSIIGGSCTEGARVKAGASCSVEIILTPTVIGVIEANLIVAETGFDPLVVSTPIRGAGGEPALIASPAVADYGTSKVNTVSQYTQIFQVASVSYFPVWVAQAKLSGANPEDFIILSSNCGDELSIDATCDVEVTFRPTAAGRRTATLSFSTVAGQYTSVLLAGEGVYQPELLAAPSVMPGDQLGVGGSGFPADAGVLISWSDGDGWTQLVATDADGAFLTNLLVSRNRPSGTATLVAQAVDGTTATIQVDIERLPPRVRPGR